MKICTIQWEETIPLRHSVLWPGESKEYCQVNDDEHGLHFGTFIDDVIVCVASIYLTEDRARLRKFATDAAFQNQGIGTKMLGHIVQTLSRNHVKFLWCDARESALGLYKRFGMSQNSDRFYKGNVAYFKMEVAL
jgi:GNAT superfamily N-acetyltransferase